MFRSNLGPRYIESSNTAGEGFTLACVVPVTGTPGEGALYPRLTPGPSGLTKTSYALLDHLRSVDKRRVRRRFGHISGPELETVDEGLALLLGLGSRFDRFPASGAR
jgi:mRNA-degrading endonuclease toxin of MazEF toxin-antitoxin module